MKLYKANAFKNKTKQVEITPYLYKAYIIFFKQVYHDLTLLDMR